MKIIVFVQFFVLLISQLLQVSQPTNQKNYCFFCDLFSFIILLMSIRCFLQFLQVSHLTNYKTIALQFLPREILKESKELKGDMGEYFKKLRIYENYSFCFVFCFLVSQLFQVSQPHTYFKNYSFAVSIKRNNRRI